MKELNMVLEWHKKYNVPIVHEPTKVHRDRIKLRIKILEEEINELIEADETGNIEHIAKECSDVVYVILGTVLEFGYIKAFKNKRMFQTYLHNESKSESLDSLVDYLHLFEKDWCCGHLESLLWDIEEYIHFAGLKLLWNDIFSEVHRSNMSKGTNGKPVIREDGKILKGKDFSPADLSFICISEYLFFTES